ncbi:MAG: glycosyl hydrolase [bacterium]
MTSGIFTDKKNILSKLPLIISLFLTSCMAEFNSIEFQKEVGIRLADSNATKETVVLYHNLKQLSQNKTIFGHHHTSAYGIGWRGDDNRSDVKDVCGSFPGLYGWDFADFNSADTTGFAKLVTSRIIEAHARGGVNTLCWHLNNPITDQIFYDTTIAVKHILPGGKYFQKYLRILDSLAETTKQLVDANGNPIPIIFRPFHEFDGSWFWWGKKFCTREEFIRLWQVTVDYLRDYKNLRNIIYAFSPDRNFYNKEELLDRYPGDEYVDVIGMDDYYDFTPEGDGLDWVTKKLRLVTEVAKEKNKLAAFTETGSETIPDTSWWTDKLLKVINDDSVKIAYVMVWRNGWERHYYAPHPGHPSAENFVEFRKNPKILFEDDLPPLYNQLINDSHTIKVTTKESNK